MRLERKERPGDGSALYGKPSEKIWTLSLKHRGATQRSEVRTEPWPALGLEGFSLWPYRIGTD